MKGIWDVLRWTLRHAVELLSSVAMMIAGVLLQVIEGSSNEPNRTLLVAGALLLALGGVLLSWVASKALAEGQARTAVKSVRRETDQKLDNMSRMLGQASGQITQALEQHDLAQLSPESCLALVAQANRMIYGQVNEIAVMRGARFDPAYLLETASTLDGLARELSTSGASSTGSPAIDSVRERLAGVRMDLAAGSGVQRSLTTEAVACPACSGETNVTLGSVPGDTAVGKCSKCKQPFNAHRSSSGVPFTRALGGTQKSAKDAIAPWHFRCVECNSSMKSPPSHSPRTMICMSCDTALTVDPVAREVEASGKFERVLATHFTRKGVRPQVECPKCSKRINAHLLYDGGFLGTCTDDLVAVLVGRAMWEEGLT